MHGHPLSKAARWLIALDLDAIAVCVGFLALLGIAALIARTEERRIAQLRREHYARYFPHLMDDQDDKPDQL